MFLKKATFLRPISNVQNASGVIQIVTDGVHGLVTGNVVLIAGCTSTDVINGVWTITRIDDTTFTLTGSTYSAGATAFGQVYVGDRIAVEVTTYPGTAAHITAQVKKQDPASNRLGELDCVRTSAGSAATFVILNPSELYNLSIESLNILNRHASANLLVKIKYIDYQGTVFEIGTATIEHGERYSQSHTGFSDVITPTGRSATGIVGAP